MGSRVENAGLAAERVQSLGSWLCEIAHEAAGAPIESRADWNNIEVSGWGGVEGAKTFVVSFRRKGVEEPFAHYYFISWQPLFEPRGDLHARLLRPKLVTVTHEALIFESLWARDTSEEANRIGERLSKAVAEAIKLEQHERAPEHFPSRPFPEGLQVIAVNAHQRYVTIQVALPGSKNPNDAELRALWPGVMIELVVVPDIGPVHRRWLIPVPEASRVGVEQHQEEGLEPPGEMIEPFGHYTRKVTPDTVLDYRGEIDSRLQELPPAELDGLPALLARLDEQKGLAARNPGCFTPGNVILGADREQYMPSDEELLESELGDRIRRVIAHADPGELAATLDGAGITLTEVTYREISFRHADVMGSGRFFYASAPIPARVVLRSQ